MFLLASQKSAGLASALCLAAALLLAPAAADAGTDMELAKKYYKLGAELYKRGDFKAALYQFEASYRHSKRPELLYNMGRCREGMDQPALAIARYNEYLKTAPANAAEVRAHMKRLQNQVKVRQAKGEHPAESVGEGGRPMRITGWALVGAGAAGLVAGGVLGGLALSKQGSVEEAYNSKEKTYPELQDEIDAGEGLELGAIISLAVGGAAAAAGAALLIVHAMRGGGEERSAWIVPGFTADGAMVSVGLRF